MRRSFLLFVLPFLFLASCFSSESENSSGSASGFSPPEADAEGIEGIIKVSDLTLDNGRILCAFSERTRSPFLVKCRAAYIDNEGNTKEATGIAPHTKIDWLPPERVSGAPVRKQVCQEDPSQLSQECELYLEGPEGSDAKIKFFAKISDTKVSEAREESSIVYLPFSVRTYGLTPQVPMTFSSSDGEKLTYTNRTFEPLDTPFTYINSACQIGERVFFNTPQQIYVLENGVVRLYAGGGNPLGYKDFSHRLRTYFGRLMRIYMVCGKDAIYVLNRTNNSGYWMDPIGRILKITDTSIKEIPLPKIKYFPATAIESNPLHAARGIAIYDDKTIFITSELDRIVKIVLPTEEDPGEATVIAGSGTEGYSGDGGSALEAELENPSAITVGKDTTIYFAEKSGERLRKITSNGTLSTVANFGTAYFKDTDFFSGRQPGIVLNPDGSFWYPNELAGKKITKVEANGSFSQKTIPGITGGEFGMAVSGLTQTPAGDTLVTNRDSVWLLKKDFSIKRLAGRTLTPEEALAKKSMGRIVGMTFLPNDTLIVADSDNGKILKISASGDFTHVKGIAYPQSITTGPDGSLFVLTSSKIQKMDPNGNWTVLNENGNTGLGDGGPVSQATFNQASSIIAGADGSLYIADSGNHRIRRVAPNGIIQTIAGGESAGSTGDGGPATDAALYWPSALALSSNGLLFVGNLTSIRQVDLLTGIITTIAGSTWLPADPKSPTGAKQVKDGELALNFGISPGVLSSTSDGKVYFTDTKEHAIRYLVPEQNSGLTRYRVFTFLKGEHQGDCGSGIYSGDSSSEQIVDKIRGSLGVLCVGRLTSLNIRSSCASSGGTVRMVFSQYLADYVATAGSIVSVERACTPAEKVQP